ncbi:hypothetical protein NA56DRAFT_148273 [Hyaloscypha hepaticicola]|uniref:Uncharacterized protein n=1 Tax=Hyaloscypha hepaticicola TaxID=2082293 RepID=A0A2J6QNI8_9HELO|nr:hypothetical protein NA56DRAFT_148273 [Hyaloscypha hepaticicola]
MQSIRRQILARPYSPALAGTKKAHSLQQESYHIKVKCSHKQRSSVKGKRYLGRDQASPTLFSNVRKSTRLSLYSQPYRYHLLVLPKIKNQPTPSKDVKESKAEKTRQKSHCLRGEARLRSCQPSPAPFSNIRKATRLSLNSSLTATLTSSFPKSESKSEYK